MSEKSKKILQLQGEVTLDHEVPELPSDLKLIEVGLACVLARRLTTAQVEKTLKALSGAYPDWNELRVAQVQEFVGLLATRSDELSTQVARDVKAYLQEVFQKNHGFDLEFVREDLNEAGKFVAQLEFLGASAGHFLIWYAYRGQAPATPGLVRVLDRLGLVKRTSSMRKAQETLDKLVPEASRRDFALRFGLVVERWCDAKKPVCWECRLVESCPYGKKVRKDWTVQQKRLEEQRKREAERRLKEEEKARRKALQEAKRRAVEEAKRKAKEERERKRREQLKAREEARRKAQLAKEAEKAARKKAQLEKQKAAEKKRAAAKKKAASRKKVAKKSSKKRAKSAKPQTKARSRKKTSTKKTSTKKTASKKTASKKRTSTRRSKAAPKSAARKPAQKKSSKKKTTSRKPATRRPSAKKSTKRSTTKKRPSRRR